MLCAVLVANHKKEVVELEKVKKRMTRLIKGTERLLCEKKLIN